MNNFSSYCRVGAWAGEWGRGGRGNETEGKGGVAGKWVGELKSESEGAPETLKNMRRGFRRNYER